METVEEEYVPHIQPPIQPLSWAEVCGSEKDKWRFMIISLTQFIWYSALNYFSNPWALIILLYLVYRLKLKSKSSITILDC